MMSSANRTARMLAVAIIVIIAVAVVLSLGFGFALAEGFRPQTWQQWVVGLLVVGPLVLLGESLLEGLCWLMGLVLRRVPFIEKVFKRIPDEGLPIVVLVLLLSLVAVGFVLFQS